MHTQGTLSRPNGRTLVRITQKEYAELQAKAKAHDAYLAACRVMAARQAKVLDESVPQAWSAFPLWRRGWLDCLREFSEAVAHAE